MGPSAWAKRSSSNMRTVHPSRHCCAKTAHNFRCSGAFLPSRIVIVVRLNYLLKKHAGCLELRRSTQRTKHFNTMSNAMKFLSKFRRTAGSRSLPPFAWKRSTLDALTGNAIPPW